MHHPVDAHPGRDRGPVPACGDQALHRRVDRGSVEVAREHGRPSGGHDAHRIGRARDLQAHHVGMAPIVAMGTAHGHLAAARGRQARDHHAAGLGDVARQLPGGQAQPPPGVQDRAQRIEPHRADSARDECHARADQEHVGVALVRAPEVRVARGQRVAQPRRGPIRGPVVVHAASIPVAAAIRRIAAVGTSCRAQTSGAQAAIRRAIASVSLRLTCMCTPSSSGVPSHVDRRVAPRPGSPSRPWKRFQVITRIVRSGIGRDSPLAPGIASVKIARRARPPPPLPGGRPFPLGRPPTGSGGPPLRRLGSLFQPFFLLGFWESLPFLFSPPGWRGACSRARCPLCRPRLRSELGRPRPRALPLPRQARRRHQPAALPGRLLLPRHLHQVGGLRPGLLQARGAGQRPGQAAPRLPGRGLHPLAELRRGHRRARSSC